MGGPEGGRVGGWWRVCKGMWARRRGHDDGCGCMGRGKGGWKGCRGEEIGKGAASELGANY